MSKSLSHVCRRFREVSLASGDLWSFSWVDTSLPAPSQEFLTTDIRLHRSKQAYMSVHVGIHQPSGSWIMMQCTDFLAKVIPHQHRWTSLALRHGFPLRSTVDYDSPRLQELYTSLCDLNLPSLRSLRIVFYTKGFRGGSVWLPHHGGVPSFSFSGENTPNLRTLSVINYIPYAAAGPVAMPFTKIITSLELSVVECGIVVDALVRVVGLLEACSALADLTLRFHDLNVTENLPADPDRYLEEIVFLRCLKTLSIHLLRAPVKPILRTLFKRIHLPDLLAMEITLRLCYGSTSRKGPYPIDLTEVLSPFFVPTKDGDSKDYQRLRVLHVGFSMDEDCWSLSGECTARLPLRKMPALEWLDLDVDVDKWPLRDVHIPDNDGVRPDLVWWPRAAYSFGNEDLLELRRKWKGSEGSSSS